MKALEHASFPGIAERVSALYNEDEDAMLLAMLGQEYIIRHEGIFLHGQKAPGHHAGVIMNYLFSQGTSITVMPWRTINDFSGRSFPEFRQKVEVPVTQCAAEFITRANSILPMCDGKAVHSIIGSDMAVTIRALPKVYLRVELSQETKDFPAEVWVLFSHNANKFLNVANMQTLGEIFKERVLSLLRIY